MKNNKGFSLTEVVVTCGILAIIGGIGLANFGSYEDPTQKKELLQSAKIFSMRVKNCILNVSSMGGWKIKQADNTYMYPCKATDKAELKKFLGWDCPSDSTCEGVMDAGGKFYCLNIQKEKKGTKYQCIVHFNIDRQNEEIYCGTPTSWEAFTVSSCVSSPTYQADLKLSDTKWQDEAGLSTPKKQGDANVGVGGGNGGGNGGGGNGNGNTGNSQHTQSQQGKNTQNRQGAL